MAHSKRSLTQQMEEELTCAVCCELYTCPLLLKCSHTFCKKCIQDLVRNSDEGERYGAFSSSFKCPVCRAFISLKSARGINDLPENLALANLIGVLQSSEEIKTLFSRQEVPPLEIPTCAWHPDSDCTVDFFCADCLKIYCRQSIPQRCYDHDLKKSDTIWNDTWKRVNRLMNEAGEQMSSLIDRVHLLDDHLVAIEHQESSSKSELKAEIDILQSMLKCRLAQLNAEMNREVQGIRYPVVHDREDCSQLLNVIEAIVATMEKLQDSNDGVRSIRNLMVLEKSLTNELRENAPKLLNRSIPVIAMPTWKLLRENTETSIRTLIMRKTGPFPSPSSSRNRGSPASMRTSPEKEICWTDNLATDVTMKSSSRNSDTNKPTSILRSQEAAALPSSKEDQRITTSRSFSSQQPVVSTTNQNNSATRVSQQNPLRITALRPSAHVNDNKSAVRVLESSRCRLQPTPAPSSSFQPAAGAASVFSGGPDTARKLATAHRRASDSRRSVSRSNSNRSSASGISTSGTSTASGASNGSKDVSVHFRTSLNNNMDSILSALKKIEVKVEEWDVHTNKKVKVKNTASEFKDFGTTVPSTFQFGSSDQADANSAFVFGSATNTTQAEASSQPGQSQAGASLVSTGFNSLFSMSSAASNSSTGLPVIGKSGKSGPTTSLGGFSFSHVKNQQTSSVTLTSGFLSNSFNSLSNPFASTSGSNSVFSFPSTQARTSAATTNGFFSSSNTVLSIPNFSAGNTTPSSRRPNKANRPKNDKGPDSRQNFFLNTNKIDFAAPTIGQNSGSPFVEVSKQGDQTKGLPIPGFSFRSTNVDKSSESSGQPSRQSVQPHVSQLSGIGMKSNALKTMDLSTQTTLLQPFSEDFEPRDGQRREHSSSSGSESGNESQRSLGSFLARRTERHHDSNDVKDPSSPSQGHLPPQVQMADPEDDLKGQGHRLGKNDVRDVKDGNSSTELNKGLGYGQEEEATGTPEHKIFLKDTVKDGVSSLCHVDEEKVSSDVSSDLEVNGGSALSLLSSYIDLDELQQDDFVSSVPNNSNSRTAPVMSAVVVQSHVSTQHASVTPANSIPFPTVCQDQNSTASSNHFAFNLPQLRSKDESSQHGHAKPPNRVNTVQQEESLVAGSNTFSSNLLSGSKDGLVKPANSTFSETLAQEQSSSTASSKPFSFNLSSQSSEETFKFGGSGGGAKFTFEPSSNSGSSSEIFKDGFSNLFGNSTSDSHPQLSFGFPSSTGTGFGSTPTTTGGGLFHFGKKKDSS